ncbi:hypothetical protein JCM21900_002323 [Sporobolomyces salmonicolor]
MDPAAPVSPEPDAQPEPPASPRARSSTPTDPDATLGAYRRAVDRLLNSVPSPALSQVDCFSSSSNYQRSVAYGRAGTEEWMTRVEGDVSCLPARARRFEPTPAPPPPPPPQPQPQPPADSASKSKSKPKPKSKSNSKPKSKKRPRSPAPNEDDDEGDDRVKTEPEAGAGERKKAKTGESSTGDGPEELGRGMRACAGRAAGTTATPAPEQ